MVVVYCGDDKANQKFENEEAEQRVTNADENTDENKTMLGTLRFVVESFLVFESGTRQVWEGRRGFWTL